MFVFIWIKPGDILISSLVDTDLLLRYWEIGMMSPEFSVCTSQIIRKTCFDLPVFIC